MTDAAAELIIQTFVQQFFARWRRSEKSFHYPPEAQFQNQAVTEAKVCPTVVRRTNTG